MRNLIYILTILVIVSCSGKEERPKGVIPPEKMALILSDIYFAEHKATNIRVKPDSAKQILRHYELQIFDRYDTSDSLYKESFKYYLEHPVALEGIYDIVVDTLSLRDQIEAERTKQ